LTNPIDVEIYGQQYSIKGEANEEYVQRLASYVNTHMKNVGQGMKTATLSKVAVLAAINIAHELFQAEQIREDREADVERRVLSLMDSIEEQISSSPDISRSML